MDILKNILKVKDARKQITIIATGASLLLFIFIVFFIFLPALKQSRLLTNRIKDKKSNLEKTRKSNSEFELLKEKINEEREELKAVYARLFWEKDISRFLNALTMLASDLKIEFVSVKPEIVATKEKGKKDSTSSLFQHIPISVSIKSDYSDLIQFIKRIEEADKFIKIDSLRIEADEREILRHNIKMNLSVMSKEEG